VGSRLDVDGELLIGRSAEGPSLLGGDPKISRRHALMTASSISGRRPVSRSLRRCGPFQSIAARRRLAVASRRNQERRRTQTTASTPVPAMARGRSSGEDERPVAGIERGERGLDVDLYLSGRGRFANPSHVGGPSMPTRPGRAASRARTATPITAPSKHSVGENVVAEGPQGGAETPGPGRRSRVGDRCQPSTTATTPSAVATALDDMDCERRPPKGRPLLGD